MAAAHAAGRAAQKVDKLATCSTGCYCYIVECADGTLYTGWTVDLERRVAMHNAGRGSRYTRLHRPVKLVYFEPCANRAAAMRREAQIKHMKRSAKLALIKSAV